MPTPAPPPAPPRPTEGGADPLLGRTASHYRLDERLGRGGMGVVYRARDLTLGRDVALKFLPPGLQADAAARGQLLREARAASALDHAHVASVYEVGEAEDGRLFLAMAYYDGQTVEEAVAEGPLPVARAVDVALQAGAGLARAHRAGIVHRDVKPSNLVVTADGVVKVLDFGIATAEGTGGGAGDASGSAPYMSPEQAAGLPSDARTDVWGLGVTLYEMLAGRPAFSGAFTTAVLYAVLHTEPRPVAELRPDLPAPLAAVVARCLAKDPDDRYPTVDALLDDLRPFGPQTAPRSTPALARLRIRFRRLSLVGQVGLAVAAALVVLAAAWGALRPGVSDDQHLVVLPFRTPGGDAETETLAAGLLETVTSRLSQLEQFGGALMVVPASEVEAGMSPTDARDQLGATLAVDGTVQVEDGRVRLLLNLIDTETRRLVGSVQVDHAEGSPLAVQDEAVRALARMLEVEVEPEVREALVAGGTDDAEANALFLRGRGLLREQRSAADIERAAGLLRRATQRDPDFALAHAALAEALWEAYGLTSDPALADRAAVHSGRALALDAGSAPVHVSTAVIYAGRQEYGRALEALDRALEVAPRNAEAVRQRASVYQSLGRVDDAEAAFTEAIALKPDYWRGYSSLGAFYYSEGRLDEAIALFEGALVVAPSNLTALNNLGAVLWESGRLDEAEDVFVRVLRVDPDNAWAAQNRATARFYSGDFSRAAELYRRERARLPDSPALSLYLGDAQWWASEPGRRSAARASYRAALTAARRQLAVARSPEVLSVLATAHARLGARDSARAYLTEIVGVRAPDGFDPWTAFGVGETYEAVGDRAEAVRWVRSAVDRGYGAVPLDHSPWLRDLRRDARLSPRS